MSILPIASVLIDPVDKIANFWDIAWCTTFTEEKSELDKLTTTQKQLYDLWTNDPFGSVKNYELKLS